MTGDEELNLKSLGRDSSHFLRRVIELAPGEELQVDARIWRDAIVFLEIGEVELTCVAGECRRFATGATLCLAAPVRVVRNCGADGARLLAISRRTRERRHRSG